MISLSHSSTTSLYLRAPLGCDEIAINLILAADTPLTYSHTTSLGTRFMFDGRPGTDSFTLVLWLLLGAVYVLPVLVGLITLVFTIQRWRMAFMVSLPICGAKLTAIYFAPGLSLLALSLGIIFSQALTLLLGSVEGAPLRPWLLILVGMIGMAAAAGLRNLALRALTRIMQQRSAIETQYP